jgi:hypothetical protein
MLGHLATVRITTTTTFSCWHEELWEEAVKTPQNGKLAIQFFRFLIR